MYSSLSAQRGFIGREALPPPRTVEWTSCRVHQRPEGRIGVFSTCLGKVAVENWPSSWACPQARSTSGAGTEPRSKALRAFHSIAGSSSRASPRAGAAAIPDPHPAAASARHPACGAPTSAVGARAWTRLRQRDRRAPTGPRPSQRPRPSSTSLQSSTCKAVAQRTIGRGIRCGGLRLTKAWAFPKAAPGTSTGSN